MALKLIANYSKRLGLPGYSSHQFSVSVETEISNINDVAGESTRLYQTLQQSVDDEIQHTGFVPDAGYGISEQGARNGRRNGTNGHSAPTNGNTNGHATNTNGSTNGDAWACSEKQQELIVKLVDEHSLDKGQVDDTSREMFGVGVRELTSASAPCRSPSASQSLIRSPHRGSSAMLLRNTFKGNRDEQAVFFRKNPRVAL